MIPTIKSDLDTRVKSAREALDAWVREMVSWHFDPATGAFYGAPAANASQGGPNHDGVYAVTITATDNNGATVTTVVTFKIANVPPVAADDTATVTEHGSMQGSVLGNDHDGGGDTDPLSVSMVNGVAASVGTEITLPSGALLTLRADGTYDYNPNGAFVQLAVGETGMDTFKYTIKHWTLNV